VWSSGYTPVGVHGGYCTMPAFLSLLLYEWRFESHVLLEVTMGSSWLQKGLLMPASESCADLLAQLTALYDVPGVSCEYENRSPASVCRSSTDDDLAAAIKCADAPFVRCTSRRCTAASRSPWRRRRACAPRCRQFSRCIAPPTPSPTPIPRRRPTRRSRTYSDELALALTLDTCSSLDTVRDVLAAVAGERARSGQQSSWSALPNVTPPESPLRSHAGTAPMPLARQHVRPMSEPELHDQHHSLSRLRLRRHAPGQGRSQSVSSAGSSSSAGSV
jgi:hypothetical protein